jgi:hypothetical protein
MLKQFESYYVQGADERAQEFFRVWRDVGTSLTPEFKTVLHKAFSYCDNKRSADAYRACGIVGAGLEALRAEAEAKEGEAKLEFAQARLDFDLLHGIASN